MHFHKNCALVTTYILTYIIYTYIFACAKVLLLIDGMYFKVATQYNIYTY